MALPTVHITDVPEQGLTLTCVVQPEELALSADEGRFPGALMLDVEVHPVDQGLSARGVLRGRVIRECVRCVEEYEEPIDVEFSAEYRMAPQPKKGRHRAEAAPPVQQPEDGGRLDPDEDDQERYVLTGDRLDLAEMLREQVILTSPMHPFCRENCLGLCATCGQNRNHGLCGCREPRESSPFEALRDLKLTPNFESARVAESSRKPPKASRD